MHRLPHAVVAFLLLAGCTGGPTPSPTGGADGVEVVSFEVDSELLGERLTQVGLLPPARDDGRPRKLLVFLHGRGSSGERVVELQGMAEALADLGDDAPAIVIVHGGEASYYHDRDDGPWGRYVIEEAIPAAEDALGAVALGGGIGGESMGGFGALDLARRHPLFCAIGGHSPAIWRAWEDTRPGAFDDAEDFRAHDLLADAEANPVLFRNTRVWLDVGESDPFRPTVTALAGAIADEPGVTFTVRPGGHNDAYWAQNMRDYLAWYAETLSTCDILS